MTHRFPDWSFERTPAPAFVPCPAGLVPVAHAAFVAEVYRLALEQTRQQLAEPASSWVAEFSRN